MKLYWIDFKNIRFLGLVPLVAAWLFFPLTVGLLVAYGGYSQSNVFDFSYYAQMYLPFFACWWTVFVLRNYADGGGRELLHLYRKSQFGEWCFLFACYALVLAAPYTVLSFFYQQIGFEYLRILTESLFLASLAYCVLFAFRSATAALLVNLVYVSLTVFSKAGVTQYYSIFTPMLNAADVSPVLFAVTLALSAAFLALGRWRNKRLF